MSYSWNLGIKIGEVARANKERIALRNLDGTTIPYGQLDELSNRLATLFLERGLKRGDVAAIFHDKSSIAYASMLACLKCGIIYANLDPDSPWERLRKILHTCEPKVFINTFHNCPHVENLTSLPGLVLHLRTHEVQDELRESSTEQPSAITEVTGADPAYIMFTSGSTGAPKGAVISHANVLNFVSWAQDRFSITEEDVFTNANPIYFDNSVFDFYVSLFCGASLVPIPAESVRDPRGVVRLVNEYHCTIWFSVPSLLVYLLTTRALSATDFPFVRKIIFGGEGFPKPKLRKLFDLFAHRMDLENVYGPTECTCICSAHKVEDTDFTDMRTLTTLGFMAPNFGYEILECNEEGVGELFLRGPNVGLGYYNDEERTERSFIQNPRHRLFPDRGYCSGDLVRREQDGRIYFAGRADFQIKHLGYRIELEEIEAALATVPEVKECAVIYRRLGDGLGEIVAFAALSEPKRPEDVLSAVARLVPSYMLPKRLSVLNELPKNANGKIDRIALQAIDSNSV